MSVHLYTRMYYGSVHVYVSTYAYTLTYTFFFFAEMTDLADEFDDSTCGRWWYHLLRRGNQEESQTGSVGSYKHELSSVCADFQMKMPGRQRTHSVEFREETGWRCQIGCPSTIKAMALEEPSCEERTDRKEKPSPTWAPGNNVSVTA